MREPVSDVTSPYTVSDEDKTSLYILKLSGNEQTVAIPAM